MINKEYEFGEDAQIKLLALTLSMNRAPHCGAWHADRPYAPTTSARLPEDPLRCAICTEEASGDLRIMSDGLVVHEACCGRVN